MIADPGIHRDDDAESRSLLGARLGQRILGVEHQAVQIRQHAERHSSAVDELLALSGQPGYRALSADGQQAILERNWNRMIELGGNIYFTSKLGATDGLSFQQLAAMMTGMTQQGYADMMAGGGRPIDGNRFKSEWEAKPRG